MYRELRIGWTSNLLRVFAPQSHNIGILVQGEQPQNYRHHLFGWGIWGCCSQQKTCNISETGQDRTKVAIDDQQEVAYALSIGAKINDLG